MHCFFRITGLLKKGLGFYCGGGVESGGLLRKLLLEWSYVPSDVHLIKALFSPFKRSGVRECWPKSSSTPSCVSETRVIKTPHFCGSLYGVYDSCPSLVFLIRMFLLGPSKWCFCPFAAWHCLQTWCQLSGMCLFVCCWSMLILHEYVTVSPYRRLLGTGEKFPSIVEYRPQRSYNRTAIEMTRRSSWINFVSRLFGVQVLRTTVLNDLI